MCACLSASELGPATPWPRAGNQTHGRATPQRGPGPVLHERASAKALATQFELPAPRTPQRRQQHGCVSTQRRSVTNRIGGPAGAGPAPRAVQCAPCLGRPVQQGASSAPRRGSGCAHPRPPAPAALLVGAAPRAAALAGVAAGAARTSDAGCAVRCASSAASAARAPHKHKHERGERAGDNANLVGRV